MTEPALSAEHQNGRKLFKAGNLPEAYRIFLGLTERDGSDTTALHMLAQIAEMQADYDAAISWLTRLVELAPNVAEVYDALGTVYFRYRSDNRSLALARDNFRKALALKPNWCDVLIKLGMVCSSIGPTDEAVRVFQQAVHLDPNNIYVRYQLSEGLAELGRLIEAEPHLRAAVALNPNLNNSIVKDLAEVRNALDDLKSGKTRRSSRPALARYPTTEALRGDLRGAIIESVLGKLAVSGRLIADDARFFAMGSCFAQNIATSLKRQGKQAETMVVAEHINTTFANRYFLDWMHDRLTGELEQHIDEMFAGQKTTKADLRQRIRDADVFIYTLGVAPCFFERGSNRFVMPRTSSINARTLAERYEFRTTSVAENVENLRYIIDEIRRINPEILIVITVSPVPLKATFEFDSAVVADCISKSVLRVVAHEVMACKIDRLYYWPSFEIVRWLGGHTGPFYGTDDGAALHVSGAIIDLIVDLFLKTFTGCVLEQPDSGDALADLDAGRGRRP